VITPIFKDDVILFSLDFIESDWTPTEVFTADNGRCTVQVNTKDDDFWSQSVVDGYIMTTSSVEGYNVDTTNDWIVYEEDDDAADKYCKFELADY